MKEKLIKQYITTTSGMRGSFAVLMGEFINEKGNKWHEPISTSPFSGTSEKARIDGKQWAEAEELEFI